MNKIIDVADIIWSVYFDVGEEGDDPLIDIIGLYVYGNDEWDLIHVIDDITIDEIIEAIEEELENGAK